MSRSSQSSSWTNRSIRIGFKMLIIFRIPSPWLMTFTRNQWIINTLPCPTNSTNNTSNNCQLSLLKARELHPIKVWTIITHSKFTLPALPNCIILNRRTLDVASQVLLSAKINQWRKSISKCLKMPRAAKEIPGRTRSTTALTFQPN